MVEKNLIKNREHQLSDDDIDLDEAKENLSSIHDQYRALCLEHEDVSA